MINFDIRNVHGHYEAYVDGVFVLSGDTLGEVHKLLEECLDGMG